MLINNDQEFKQAISELNIAEQRKLAAKFVESVLYLNPDPLIKNALDIAGKEVIPSSDEKDLEEAYKSIKTLAVKTYTACGSDADWPAQAAHFIATATKACLIPMERMDNKLAWKCAIQSRLAKNCEMIESDNDIVANEAQNQYMIMNNFINH